MSGITYDTTTTAQLLGITASQLNTLQKHHQIVPANTVKPGAKKFFPRYTQEAIEAARPFADRLKTNGHASVKRSGSMPERLDRIEALLEQIIQHLTTPANGETH